MKKLLVILSAFFIAEVNAQSITEILYPRFIQGVGSSNASDDRKVPWACRMTVNGLTPNTTYRYYHRFVADTTLATNGQGYYIIANQTGDFNRVTSASLAVVGRYGELTTNASGSYTGWFVIEPSLALEFQPGTQLWFRIMLNNGAGGGSVATRINATNSVTVLGWGSAPSQGTGLRAFPNPAYIQKNFVMLYDNEAGTGRPVSGTFIENDGTDNNSLTSGYAPFYADFVDNNPNAWGLIIPNNLATGVRRVAQFSLSSGNQVNAITTTNGVYPTIPSGTINTSNANAGLNALVIAAAPLPVKLESFDGILRQQNQAQITWLSQEEINFSHYEVETSADAVRFEKIGRVDGRGSNSTYVFNHTQQPVIAYYRLRMVDLDGTFSYSRIIQLKRNESASYTIYPNPAAEQLNVRHAQAGNGAIIRITSVQGAVLIKQPVAAGSVQSRVALNRLSSGHYIIELIDGSNGWKQGFQKL